MSRLRNRLIGLAIGATGLLALGCQSGPGAAQGPLPRAIVSKEDVDSAARYEEQLSRRYEQAPPAGGRWFEVLEGPSRVLVTAPHATCPMREGKRRFVDGGTGSLAQALHDLAGVTIVVTTHAAPTDANFYDDNNFKQTIEDLLKTGRYTLLLDLHGSDATRPYDVDFGTMGGESLRGRREIVPRLRDALQAEGLAAFSQDYFPAAKAQTLTKWAAARGVPAVQLEISETCLIPAHGGKLEPYAELRLHRFSQTLSGLTRFVRTWDGATGRPAKEQPRLDSLPD